MLGYLLAYSASLFFAVSDVLVRKATGKGIPPYGNLFLSLTVGTPILAIMGLLEDPFRPPEYILVYFVIGMGHFYVGRFLFYTAVAGLGASSSAVLVSATPLVSSMLAWVVLGESFTLRLGIALVLVLMASYIALRNPSGRPYHNVSKTLGVLAGVVAVFIFAASTVAVRWLGFTLDSPALGALSSYVGAYPLAVATLYHKGGETGSRVWARDAVLVSMLGGIAVTLAQASRYGSLELITVPEASVLFGLFPVNTAIISILIGGEEEKPGKKHVVAALLAFTAVAVAFSPIP